VDPGEAARCWAHEWAEGWRAHDAERIAALYADDAVFRSQPFREPHSGPAGARAYAEWAFSEEDSVECWFGEPIVSGVRAAVEYWAIVAWQGREQTIAGIAVLRFVEDGRVAEQRDYWSMQQGRHLPGETWGR